jgi:alpha-ketoglutarate-dependent taurine dioxygenase
VSFPLCLTPRRSDRVTGLDVGDIAAALRAHGAVLFRGFLPDEGAFEALTEVFSERFLIDEGVTRAVVPHLDPPTRQVVSPQPEYPFGLHAELATSTAVRPHLLWLYCVHPAASGGETLLCDGAALYEALSASTRAALGPGVLVRHAGREPVPLLSQARYAAAPAFANALVGRPSYAALAGWVTLSDGAPIPREAWEEARAVAESLTVAIRWQSGDLLMIDNLRCMHGRRPLPSGDPRTLYSRVAWDLRERFC